MLVKVLGSASIGGVPEWDCVCKNCQNARLESTLRRTRSSIAVTINDRDFVLIDAGHDLKYQLEVSGLIPREFEVGESLRDSRISSILLTHGHADHTVGLAEFCTGKSFEIPVYGPPDLIKFLFGTNDKPNYFGQLGRLAKNYVIPFSLEPTEYEIFFNELKIKGHKVHHTKIMDDGSYFPSTTYAYELEHNGKKLIYAPDLGKLTDDFLNVIEEADVFIMDATFWWDNELERISGIPVTSYQLGHVPVEDSIEILKDVGVNRVIYTHFNHTNPLLDKTEPFVEKVHKAGYEIGFDGMHIIL
jgi:pyrroloquinoline quinone biosynthesis protein B